MNVEYINPFLTAAISVFETMVGVKLVRQQPFVKKSMQPQNEVSGIIGLSGKAKGTVVLSIEREVALNATGVMLMERPGQINADVVDAIGELTNVIAGNAKAQLEHLNMSVGLPSVITGKGHCIDFPSHSKPIAIPFRCEWGDVVVEVGLVEEREEAAQT